MKPAAIGATLLLHVALIGTVVYGGTNRNASLTEGAPLEIALLAGAPSASKAMPAQEAPPKRRSAAADNPSLTASKHEAMAESKPAAPHHASPVNTQGSPTMASGPDGKAPQKSGVSIPASYAASNRKPSYPALSVRMEEEGTVWLRTLVRADGSAGEVRVGKSSGYPLLDSAAVSAVRAWRFRPALLNNRPIAEWYQLPIRFTLPKFRS